ncbi:MAG: hypothetical protein HY075_06500 [Deltaproteobacteria bacterium]|nr:hypothetical protein [Deltaproteobacteria bacterium]
MKNVTWLGACALCLLARSAMAAAGGLFQPGDVNGDGKIDGKDVSLVYNVVYGGAKVSGAELAAMDLNGDGIVNVDDVVDAMNVFNKKAQAPTPRFRPEKLPRVIPRYVDYQWWLAPDKRVAADLERRMKALREGMRASTYDNPTDTWIDDFKKLKKDFELAVYYGLADDTGALCKGMNDLNTDIEWKEKALSEYLAAADGRDYVQGCVGKLGDGERKISGSWSDYTCYSKFLFVKLPEARNTYAFYVKKKNGKFHVRMPVSLGFDDDVKQADRDEFYQKWDDAVSCARTYWKRYGVDYEFDYAADDGVAKVRVRNGDKRGSSSELYLSSPYIPQLCSWVIHEFGHWMGLRDDYNEEGFHCDGRHPGDLDSMMNQGAVASPRELKWYPRHLEELFGSVCGPVSSSLVKR